MTDFAKPISQLASRQVQVDPHPGQGIALDHLSLIPANALGSGSTATNVFLAGDRSWRTVAGGGGGGSYAIVASNTTFANTTVSISGFGAATINTAANLIRVSVPVQTAETAISGIAASNTTYTSGTVTITGVGGGITVSSNTGQRIDLSVAAQSAQTQSNIQALVATNTTYQTGSVTITGSNMVTVKSSAAGQAIIIDATQTGTQFSAGVSNIGNTSGGTKTVAGQLVLAGGNNITLSQDTLGASATVTISGANAQTAISGIAASNTTYTSGTVSFTGVGGGVTVSSNTGQRVDISVASQSVQTQLIPPPLTYFDNVVGGMTGGLSSSPLASIAHVFDSLTVFPLLPGANIFPGAMTASTAMVQFSVSATASSSHSSTVYIGVYSRNNSTQLTMINSMSTTWQQAAATNQTASYHGLRWITIHSSLWSASPTFSQGQYWIGLGIRSSNASHTGSFVGQWVAHTVQRSGSIMSSVATNTTMAHYPFQGILSVSTSKPPNSIANSDLNKVSANANFVHNIVFNNHASSF